MKKKINELSKVLLFFFKSQIQCMNKKNKKEKRKKTLTNRHERYLHSSRSIHFDWIWSNVCGDRKKKKKFLKKKKKSEIDT